MDESCHTHDTHIHTGAGTVGACLYLMLRYKDGAAFDVEVGGMSHI